MANIFPTIDWSNSCIINNVNMCPQSHAIDYLVCKLEWKYVYLQCHGRDWSIGTVECSISFNFISSIKHFLIHIIKYHQLVLRVWEVLGNIYMLFKVHVFMFDSHSVKGMHWTSCENRICNKVHCDHRQLKINLF